MNIRTVRIIEQVSAVINTVIVSKFYVALKCKRIVKTLSVETLHKALIGCK